MPKPKQAALIEFQISNNTMLTTYLYQDFSACSGAYNLHEKSFQMIISKFNTKKPSIRFNDKSKTKSTYLGKEKHFILLLSFWIIVSFNLIQKMLESFQIFMSKANVW